ncbi:MAG TPA: 3-deoxy-7-phosphoheptulonate synthase [Actinomycetota bacterium]
MVIVMRADATAEHVGTVVERAESLGIMAHIAKGTDRTIISVIADERFVDPQTFEPLEGVERVVPILHRFRLASRDFHPENRVIELPGGVRLGGSGVVMMAGPCAVESREQLYEAAEAVHAAGVKILRAGAFKPRTSPYSFQGLGEKGLLMLREVADELGMAVITEVVTPEDVPQVAEHAEMLQIGTRNMANFGLLRAVGKAAKPVLLKRGWGATLDELLLAAEYVLAEGNEQVAVCERGIRTFETSTRFTVDINAIPALKQMSSLPVVVDPSHGTGRAELVAPVARAGVAAGADGLLVEVHPNPPEALSDGAQALTPLGFALLMEEVRRVASAVGRQVS